MKFLWMLLKQKRGFKLLFFSFFFFLTSESWKCKLHSVRRKPGYLLGFFFLMGSSDKNILINSSGGKIRYWYKQKAEVYFRKRVLKTSVLGAKQCHASWKNIMSSNSFSYWKWLIFIMWKVVDLKNVWFF